MSDLNKPLIQRYPSDTIKQLAEIAQSAKKGGQRSRSITENFLKNTPQQRKRRASLIKKDEKGKIKIQSHTNFFDEFSKLCKSSMYDLGERHLNLKQEIGGSLSDFQAYLCFIKVMFGVSILLLPGAFVNGGILVSVLILILVSSLITLCMILLTQTLAKSYGTYSDLVFESMGSLGSAVFLSAVCILYLGSSILSIVVFNECLQELIKFVGLDYFYILGSIVQLIVYVILCLSVMMNLTRNNVIQLAAYTIILICTTYFIIYSLFIIFSDDSAVHNIKYYSMGYGGIMVGITIFVYEGANSVMHVRVAMKRKHNFNRVLILAMATCTTIYVIFGVVCYFAFGDDTKTFVILHFVDNWLGFTVVLLYMISIVLTFPQVIFPAFYNIEQKLYPEANAVVVNLLRALIVFGCIVVATFAYNYTDAMISLIGAVCCTIISFTFPVIIYTRLSERTGGIFLLAAFVIGVALAAEIYTIYFNVILINYRSS